MEQMASYIAGLRGALANACLKMCDLREKGEISNVSVVYIQRLDIFLSKRARCAVFIPRLGEWKIG